MAAPTPLPHEGAASPTFAQTTTEFRLSSDVSDSDAFYERVDSEDEISGLQGHGRGRRGMGKGAADEDAVMWAPADDDGEGEDYDEEDDDSDDERRGPRGIRLHPRSASVSTTASFQLYSREEEEEVVRKFDRKLVVFVALLYMLSFIDRSNIGNARIAGMHEDLQTDPPRDDWYEWALSSFYITYIIFEWMSLLWKVFPAHIYVSTLVFSWGIIASLQALATSYPMLIGLRAALGIGEAGFTGVPFYLSFFYKRNELAFRTAVFISAAPLASSFASTLAWLIVKFGKASPIAPWRVLFLVEGFPSILVAVAAWRIIPDSPQTARYLTPRQKKVARLRLRAEKAHHPSKSPSLSPSGGKGGGLQIRDVLAALIDPVSWMTAFMFFLTNMAYSSFPVFLPTILKEMGHSPLASQGLSAPPYLFAFAFVLLTARASDNTRSRSPFIIIHAVQSLLGYTLLAYAEPLGLAPSIRYLALFPACIGFFSVVALTVTWSINNQPTESRQGGGFALLQLVGQCGPLLGTRLYPAVDAPYYAEGMHACAGAMLGVVFLAISLRFYMRWWNRKMDREAIEGNVAVDGEEDGLVGSSSRRRSSRGPFRYML